MALWILHLIIEGLIFAPFSKKENNTFLIFLEGIYQQKLMIFSIKTLGGYFPTKSHGIFIPWRLFFLKKLMRFAPKPLEGIVYNKTHEIFPKNPRRVFYNKNSKRISKSFFLKNKKIIFSKINCLFHKMNFKWCLTHALN